MKKRVFGDVPGQPVGTTWAKRKDVARAEVHRPLMHGISGTASEGCDSIVVDGGYPDDEDYGNEIIYTGTGGYEPGTRKQIADQSFDNTNNASLIVNQLSGRPIRVIRGKKGNPKYSPTSGFRYDGLFKVEDHWNSIGKSGFQICRFHLISLAPDEVIAAVPKGKLTPPPGESNPRRIKSVATRIVRTTVVSEYVKQLYENTCQICSIQIAVPKGLISEGAHIRALGKPHNGPDTVENVLCLCPNHHSAFDLGGLYIDDDFQVFDFNGKPIGFLNLVNGHAPSPLQLKFHRDLWRYKS